MQFSKDLRSTKRGVEWPIVWGGGNSVVTSERVRVCVHVCSTGWVCACVCASESKRGRERERESQQNKMSAVSSAPGMQSNQYE